MSDFVDHQHVRDFLTIINEQAARVTAGMTEPGFMTLVRICPNTGNTLPQRFMIGDVDAMTLVAVRDAEAGFNVYVEVRTVRPGLRGRERGSIKDTYAVFALVRDNDTYDAKKTGTTGFDASLVVASSAKASHDWVFLPPGLSVEEVYAIGRGMKARCGGDANTGVITQPYRVAGTPNYPSAKKRADGRQVEPTRVVHCAGTAWTKAQLLAAFPPPAKHQQPDIPKGRTGATDASVKELVSEPSTNLHQKRSFQFHEAVKAARAAGMTPGDLEDLMRKYPNGCAEKYLEPYDRLTKEIERSWSKLGRPKVKPTYARRVESSADTARSKLRAHIENALASAAVRALAVSTGAGKTRIAAQVIAEYIKAAKLGKPVIYAVPTHKLGEEIAEQFRAHGITATVWRGREADTPDGGKMCDDLDAVKLALRAGESVEKTCCKGRGPDGPAQCAFYQTCAYQRQRKQKPDVWIVAHEALFSLSVTKKAFALIIDEAFWEAGLFGSRGVTFDEFDHVSLKYVEAANEVASLRAKLARALRRQDGDGGVPRANLIAEGLTPEDCKAAIKAEWALKQSTPIWPGMPAEQRAAARKGNVHHIRQMTSIWRAAHELLELEDPNAVSGRLFITTINETYSTRVVRTRGVDLLHSCYVGIPTLILDATLPDKAVLEQWFPGVEILESIDLPMPHTEVRQVLDAPITKRKLLTGAGRNLAAISRYVAKRFIDTGRKDTLVIAQKEVEAALADLLPDGVRVAHFNAISGLDGHKDVRLLITVGRTQPTPSDVEALASALSGIEVKPAAVQANGGTWFDSIQRGIGLKDGTGVGVNADQHPDPLAEAVRYQICEAEVIQAIGRGRGVNRTADNPLAIDILGNVVLPVAVDQVEEWRAPGLEVVMAVEGVWLNSPADMARAWPGTWKDRVAAKDWLKSRGEFPLRRASLKGNSPVLSARYQLAGNGQKKKRVWFDPDVCKDPQGWLTARVGPLAGYAVEEKAPVAGRPLEKVEVVMITPAGRRVTIEHLVGDRRVLTGRVAVSHLIRPRFMSLDAGIAA